MATAEVYRAVKSESGEGWDVENSQTSAVVAFGLTEQEAKDKAALLNEMVDEVNTGEDSDA
jgi:hypothetical protein